MVIVGVGQKNVVQLSALKDLLNVLGNLMASKAEPRVIEDRYLSIIQQQRMFDETFDRLYTSLLFMVTARIRVALEYCVQRSWLDISDTDIASDYFASAVMQCLCDVIRQDRKNPSQNHTDWELDRLVQGLLTLFG